MMVVVVNFKFHKNPITIEIKFLLILILSCRILISKLCSKCFSMVHNWKSPTASYVCCYAILHLLNFILFCLNLLFL